MSILDSTSNAAGNPNVNGYALNVYESDAGLITGQKFQLQGDISAAYRQRVAIDTVLFSDTFSGSALNSTLWSSNLTTFTTSVTGGFLTLNSGSVTTANAVARISSYRGYPVYNNFPLQMDCYAIISATIANVTAEIGFGFATGVTAPTDGVYFRYASDGSFQCCGRYNSGTEVTQTFTGVQVPQAGVRHHYTITINNDYAEFWVDNVLYCNLMIPATQGMAMLNQNTPMLLRLYNSASVPAQAVTLKISSMSISLGDMNAIKQWNDIQAGMGGGAYQGQTGETLGTTALYSNSTNPTAAVPTNTTAALGSGLGGNFWHTNTLAVNTDGIISSYQTPASSATSVAKTMMITGVRISSAVQTVLAGGPEVLQWSLAFGHTAVSLATTETVTSKAPRFIPLGFQTLAATAAVGTMATDISQQFLTPIVVQPGEFIQTVVRNIGVVGTSGTIAHLITFDGYWE